MGSSFNKFKILDKETTIVYTQDVNGNINGKFYIDAEDLSRVLMVKCRGYCQGCVPPKCLKILIFCKH